VSASVLVIDDDPLVSQFVDLVLTQAGYQVSLASTPETGLKALRQTRWDLVLLDIQMPGMSGIHLLKMLRQYQRLKVPVVMMTSRGDIETVRTASHAGANGYVVKPFTPEGLLSRIEAVLGKRDHAPSAKPAAQPPVQATYDLD
jgi:DNA-binding response OmpR family regulator